MNLEVRGDLDLASASIDMRIRAIPVGTIDLVLEKIPLIGKPVKKIKEKFAFSFSARGPASDPVVQVLKIEKHGGS
jgi:hypothetical protein